MPIKKKDTRKFKKPRRTLIGRTRTRRCQFCVEKVKEIDYKDVNRLRKHTTEKGKMLPARTTNTCAKHQRQLTLAIKRARFMALIPYVGE